MNYTINDEIRFAMAVLEAERRRREAHAMQFGFVSFRRGAGRKNPRRKRKFHRKFKRFGRARP